jgi:hypothetical protein
MDVIEPSTRLTIEVVGQAGEVIVRVLADRYRADVQKAGHGDGHYGFAVPSRKLGPDRNARFFCGEPSVELNRLPPVPDVSRTRTFERGGVLLHLDYHLAGPSVAGWALNRNRIDDRRQLVLRAGKRPLSAQRATLFRPDSMQHGGDGFSGFCLPLPTDTADLFIDDVASGLEFRIS